MQDESREKEGENEKLNKINQTIRDELETCMQENERLNQINQTIRDELENCMHADRIPDVPSESAATTFFCSR